MPPARQSSDCNLSVQADLEPASRLNSRLQSVMDLALYGIRIPA